VSVVTVLSEDREGDGEKDYGVKALFRELTSANHHARRCFSDELELKVDEYDNIEETVENDGTLSVRIELACDVFGDISVVKQVLYGLGSNCGRTTATVRQ